MMILEGECEWAIEHLHAPIRRPTPIRHLITLTTLTDYTHSAHSHSHKAGTQKLACKRAVIPPTWSTEQLGCRLTATIWNAPRTSTTRNIAYFAERIIIK